MELKIPPPLYMLFFALLMWLTSKVMPVFHVDALFLTLLAVLLGIVGFITILWAGGLFFRSNTTVNPFTPDQSSQLVVHGLYQYTRNPMYFGLLLMLIGWGLYLAAVSAFAVLPMFIVTLSHFQIKPEERELERLFGDEYRSYQRKVRRWL
ncbi:MAG: isoprenylcysteine carboxylmethyltransferase family protein [Pseudomonadales bacterium]|nr:isoprenylcysteine carboxylmethyltransferase family protein [Pseudomonadales bacterium]